MADASRDAEHGAHKPIVYVPIDPPPAEERVRRDARFAGAGERRTRYTLPDTLQTSSPVGFRTRVSLTPEEAQLLLTASSQPRPSSFIPSRAAVTEARLFEEASLTVLSSRQSTNFRGFRSVVVGQDDSATVSELVRAIDPAAPVRDGASHTHLIVSRPYRTPFTMLLTFIGHKPLASLLTVPWRALQKRFAHKDDIPTIGYLQDLHLGILADAFERAAIIASGGRARANVLLAPLAAKNGAASAQALVRLEELCGLTDAERQAGAVVGLIAQIGDVDDESLHLTEPTRTRLGAALLALRSERIQPGVNNEPQAPPAYQRRQQMDVSDALTEQCGRALYNAFSHFSGVSRDEAKRLVLLERIDVLTPGGKERLRGIRKELEEIADLVLKNLPLWADLPTGRALSGNTARGKKAFALAGQRIYVGGLARGEVEAAGLSFSHGVRAFGAAAARAALTAEVSGTTNIPAGCDLLAGICLMAGPVNQNDIGKSFFGYKDLLAGAFPGRDPTSLLVWTLKAKTVADPIGNEEQLMNAKRKGVLVDLRAGPHELVTVRRGRSLAPLRSREGRTSQERAFHAADNFVRDADGKEIAGNRGAPWPTQWANEVVWPASTPSTSSSSSGARP